MPTPKSEGIAAPMVEAAEKFAAAAERFRDVAERIASRRASLPEGFLTPYTPPTRPNICTKCEEYAGPGADGLGTCYKHNLMRFPFDSCEFFSPGAADGNAAG
jgi:hypothetical protein